MSTEISTRVYLIWLAGIVGLLLVFTLLLNFSPVAADGPSSSLIADALMPVHSAEANAPSAFGSSDSGGDFLVSVEAGYQENPAIAYNSNSDEYLVVWADYRESVSMNIYGQIYAANGVPLGENFPVANGGSSEQYPKVVYNSSADEYLVVWEQTFSDKIFGQRVGADGTLLDNLSTPEDESDPAIGFRVASCNLDDNSITLAHNPLTDEYLVVWSERYGDDANVIYGRRVGGDGDLLGSDIQMSTLVGEDITPAAAYNAINHEYMVIWAKKDGGDFDIYGRRVNLDGSLSGSSFPISTANDDQLQPALAYHAFANQYLVVWKDLRRSTVLDGNIYGQRLNFNGTLLGQNFPISTAPNNQTSPAITYNSNHRQYLVVWQDNRHNLESSHDIYGVRVGTNGSLDRRGDFSISTALHKQAFPAIAYSHLSQQYMVVWEDLPFLWGSSDKVIYGQRIWWPGLLLGHNFGISAEQVSQDTPEVAYNSDDHEYMVVWADESRGKARISYSIFDREGHALIINFASSFSESEHRNPDVTYNSITHEYAIVWSKSSGEIEMQTFGNTGNPHLFTTVYQGDRPGMQPAIAANPHPGYQDYLVVYQKWEGSDIYGRQVDSLGTPSPEGEFAICDAIRDQTQPDVVYDSINNEFLVVWADQRDYTANSNDIYGQRVGATQNNLGANFAIASETGNQQSPALTYNAENEEFLVVWEDWRIPGTSPDIYGQRVGVAGSGLPGVNFPVSTSNGADSQLAPDVIYANGQDAYRVIWHDDRNVDTGNDIYGQWVGVDGSILGAADTPVFRYTGWQQYPAMAYSPTYDRAITVWQDGRNGVDTDIYGRFGALDATPPIARFTITERWGRAGDVFTFNAWPSYDNNTPRGGLRVRWDWTSNGSWDTTLGLDKYITQTINVPGVYTVTMEVWDQAWLTDTVTHQLFVLPAVLAANTPATVNTAPTTTLTVSPTFGIAGTTFHFDGSGSTGTGTVQARWDWENDGEFDTAFSTSLTATHVYTQTEDYTVRIEMRDDTGLSSSALQNITVQVGAPVILALRPSDLTIAAGDTFPFSATGEDIYGNASRNPDVIWTLTDPAAGLIDTTGVFTASHTVGTYSNVVSVASGAISDTATVTIFWPYQIYLPLVVR